MPIYEYRCSSCGRTVEVFAQTASGIQPPLDCSCGGHGTFTREYSVFAAATAHQGGSPSHECCCGHGECGGEDCACEYPHNRSN